MIIDYEVRDLKEGIYLAKSGTGNDVYVDIRFVNEKPSSFHILHFLHFIHFILTTLSLAFAVGFLMHCTFTVFSV